MLKRIWHEDEGVLTFEWILLITLLVIGITGAISAVRDAIAAELIDVAGAIVSLDQSYSVVSPDPRRGRHCDCHAALLAALGWRRELRTRDPHDRLVPIVPTASARSGNLLHLWRETWPRWPAFRARAPTYSSLPRCRVSLHRGGQAEYFISLVRGIF